jgi:hypothetical protein
MKRNLVALLISFLRWCVPFWVGTFLLELLHAQTEVPNYGWIRFGLASYFFFVLLSFAWRLYDGIWRTGDLWIDRARWL